MRIHCVTGMHRSGTSVLARIMNLLGVNLGATGTMVGAAEENPRGFWEQEPVIDLNEDILDALGGSWADPPTLPPGWETREELAPFRPRAEELLARIFGGSTTVGWKDPRMSFLLPFWRTVVAIDTTILAVRDPGEVSRSLADRNGFETEHSAYLWLRYTVAGWLNDPGRLIIDFARLGQDIDQVVDEIVDHLGTERPDETTRSHIREFFSRDLIHHRTPTTTSGPMMSLAYYVHDLICDRAENEQIRDIVTQLDRGWRPNERYLATAREQQRLRERMWHLEKERDLVIRDLRQLQNRRAVRIALRAAEWLRPLRRLFNRIDETFSNSGRSRQD